MPRDCPAAILFGGSFDPPHRGHVDLARLARSQFEAANGLGDRVWLVYSPAARSPLKTIGPTASDADRAAMLRLALRDEERTVVWTDELDRAAAADSNAGPSYTIDSVRRALRVLPSSCKVRLLIGADQAAAFHLWRDARRVAELAPPLVMARATDDPASVIDQMRATGFWTEAELAAWNNSLCQTPLVAASSTEIRAALRSPDSSFRTAVLARLRAEVRAYIEEHDLYRP